MSTKDKICFFPTFFLFRRLQFTVRNNILDTSENSFQQKLPGLWRTYSKRLYYFSRQLTGAGHEDCEDIVQQAFIRLIKSGRRYSAGKDPKALLFTIVRNLCRDYSRKKRRWRQILHENRPAPEFDHEPADVKTGVEASVLRADAESAVGRIMESLDAEDRILVYLRFYEGMKYSEIAGIIKSPPGTVKYRIFELKKKLRPELEEYYA